MISKSLDEKAIKILQRLQFQCSKREYCSYDILSKAIKLTDGDRETAERILATLVQDKYVDDNRYSRAFALEKSSLSGWGPVKISYILSSKKIGKDIINAALDEIDTAAADKKLENVLKTKYRTLKEDSACKLKLIRFGLSRGYKYESIVSVLSKLTI